MSSHAWLIIGLCSLPVLVLIPVWLLDKRGRPDNTISHEQEKPPRRDPDGAEMRARVAA